MKKSYKVVALMLLVSTLISLFAVNASAVAQGYPMECTVYYKDESGNTLASSKTFSVNASDESAWNTGVASPSITGYALKNDGDSFVSYSIMDKYFPASNYVRHGTATYTVVYVRTYTHTVYYMYGVNTRPAAETVSKTGKPGTAYSFTSPTVSGHGPSQSTVTGTILSTNTSTTVYYYPYTYTVSYNAMGGSGAPASQTKTYGVPLTLSSTVPTKSGYTFEGWATSRGSSVVAFGAGGTYTGNSNLNLYAVWTQNSTSTPTINTYTVSYDANGGSGAPSSQTKIKDVDLTLSSVVPTRSGYTFLGWAFSSSATSAVYSSGGTYTSNSSAILYAVWQADKSGVTTYTVTYNANGGTGAPMSQIKTKGVDLQLSSIAPTRNGYTFEGWSNSSSSSHIFCTPGEYYDADADLDLYAVWTLTPTYTITFDANGGVGAPSSQIKTHDVALTLSSTVPTRSGYAFLGWSTSPIAISATYSAGGKYTSNSNATLYAVWQTDSSGTSTTICTVTYNANGGTGAPASQSVESGSKLTLSSTIPVRSGYTFKGWATKSWATSATYQPGTTWTITTNMTLYAVWQGGGTYFYTVTFDANGGSGAPDPITANYGETIEIPCTEPIKRGYNFISWIDQSSGEYYNPGDLMTVYADVSFLALWYVSKFDDDPFGDEPTEPSTYTVSYNANGGSGAPASQTKTEGVSLTLSSTKPTRSGYTFLGWSESSSATSATYSAGGTYTKDASTMLYAVWKKNTTTTTYTVSYNANGGTGAPSSQTKTKNVALTLSSVVPTRTGYTFLGWSTSSSATSATYQPGGSYTANANATLYAVWQKITYNFYVSNLVATPNELYQNESTHISFTLGLTSSESKSGVPVEVFFDGTTVYSANLDFSANGTTTIAFDLNVGGSVGDKLLTVRINWSDRANESNTADNTASVTISVRKYIETSSTAISLLGKYIAGTEVISSFFAENRADSDILPSDNISFGLEVYEISGTTETLITAQKKDSIVVPANGSNLVYFKWTIPEDAAGKTYMVKGTMNVDGKADEVNPNNNSSFITILVNDKESSQTPDTRYEEIAPSSYLPSASSPETSTGLMTWNEWEYDASTNALVLRQYGVSVSNTPTVAPDSECKSATESGDVWTMKSGYGITISWCPTLDTPSGYSAAKVDSVTGAQFASAYFPEFNYSGADGYYRTLENVGGTFEFIENADAVNDASVHFIPIYVQNGDYVVSCTASQIWTPAGMITVTQNANTVRIDGTIYDDWAKE